ncbi:MAG: TonB-dependent receptor plug domain-containing protein, partial [Rhodospirillaceae bacterium]|nr:TonB-dependent receptor plug domain-containing protein [Rhodospirillaceae bacterium]
MALLPACGFAQQPGQASEDIVVTAGFREQDLMDSPGSTTVVDARIIDARDAQHLESVLNASPNTNYSGGASRARFVQIRGVGDLEQFVDPRHFPAVG